jgi:hypothetical protein
MRRKKEKPMFSASFVPVTLPRFPLLPRRREPYHTASKTSLRLPFPHTDRRFMQSLLHGKRLTMISFEKDRLKTTAKLSLSSLFLVCCVRSDAHSQSWLKRRRWRGWIQPRLRQAGKAANDGSSSKNCAQEREETNKRTQATRRRGRRPPWF